MYRIIFSLDYEIHGNGDGSPFELMVKPTDRIISLFNSYKAKLTIFVDVAEVIKFKEYYEQSGIDKYHYKIIEDQLKFAIQSGHDIQLHIHSSYFNAKYDGNKWVQDWNEYNLAELPFKRIDEIIVKCKYYLENLLKPVDENYQCNVFRAANWSMMPSQNIVAALIKNNFIIDSSVFKYGTRKGRVTFDYTNAWDAVIPWYVDYKNINNKSSNSDLLEVPIYTEKRFIFSFITPIRIFRLVRSRFHKHKKFNKHTLSKKSSERRRFFHKITGAIFRKYAWKLDFNQLTTRMLINTCKKIEKNYSDKDIDIPIVLIGHSKTFIKLNHYLLKRFLKYIQQKENFSFSLYRDLKIEDYR